MQPVISENLLPTGGIPHAPIDIDKLTHFVETRFFWAKTLPGILRHFGDSIFPALAIRELVDRTLKIDRGQLNGGCEFLGAIRGERQNHTTCFLQEVRVSLNVSDDLLQRVRSSLHGDVMMGAVAIQPNTRYRAWVPRVVLEVAMPELLLSGVLVYLSIIAE